LKLSSEVNNEGLIRSMRLWGHGLTCLRGGRQIFAELDFSADAGEALAVTGRNGSGKSSLLRLIAGLLALEAGTVALDGGADDLTVAEQAHYLGHRDALKPRSRCWRISFLARLSGRRSLSLRRSASLEAVGIGHAADLPAAYLSAGQRRRLSIARLIAVKRPVWLLDEPTSALDTSGQAMLAGLMDAHLRSGGIILAATHGAARDFGAGPADRGGGMTALAALIRRDIGVGLRAGGGALIGVLFFVSVVVVMPFALGPDLALLKRIGPAILWLGAMLASLLTLDRLFTADQDDGSLDLIAMSRTPLELSCAAKALAHWIAAGVPLIVATPLIGILLNLDANATFAVALTLLVGTPALTFTGMIGAALAVTLRRGGLLLAVVVLPLSIPILIFGVAASNAALSEQVSFGTPFSILCALSLFTLVIGPFAAAASLRQGLD
jgi:heme exporter protein B